MSVLEKILSQCPPSFAAFLRWRVEQTPDRPAFLYPNEREQWVGLTWREVQSKVDVLAAGLLSLGLQPEDRVAIAASTRMQWILADFAINCAAGATTTIYPNTMAEDFAYIVRHSDSRILIVENDQQVAKVTATPGLADEVRWIVLMDGAGDGNKILSWQQLEERGRALLAENPALVTDTIAAIRPDSLATVIYTSGTTGLPKGVELVQQCWTYEGVAVREFDIARADDLQYLWLPLSHVFGKCLLALQVAVGFSSAVDGRIDRIVGGMGATHPTFMCGAPRIFEKVRGAVLTQFPRGGLKGRISRWAFNVGKASIPFRLAGKPLPKVLSAEYQIAHRLVFSKLQEKMGGSIRFFMSGSAKLSPQVQEWFYAAGLLLVEGYGLTETSAVSFVNHPSTPRFGTVGPVMLGTQTRIAEDGEILIKGPGVMRGYHKDPERTAEVLVDGWFHTGDIGNLDAEGNLTITDRKKDLMKTSGGKYVAPQKVESAIAANIPYVSQVVAVGDGRKYVSALLTLDRDNLARWAARHDKSHLSYAELTQIPEVHEWISKFVDRANEHLERWETVKKFAILDHELTVDDGGVTPNMKLRRAAIINQNAAIVESLYEAEE